MATEVSVRFEDEDDESSRSRGTSPQPAPTKGRAVGVSGQSEKATEPTRDELVFQAKQLGVTGYSRMNKTQLQNAINEKLTPKKRSRAKKPKAPVVEDTSFDPVKLELDLAMKESARNKAKKILKKPKSWEKPIQQTEMGNALNFLADLESTLTSDPNVEPQPTSTPITDTVFQIQPEHEPDLFKHALTQSGSGAGNTPPPPGPTTASPDPDDNGDEEYPPDVLAIPKGSQIFTSATPENPEPTQKTFVKSALKTKERLEKERSMNDALAVGQMKRRALLQTSIQKRRETLRRRREREAITERTREAKSGIKEQFDRGESDRLIRRLATFGIGRAVGIDGGIITALAEILLFQPEISKAEKEIDSLTKQVDRSAKEEFQELERSKLATSERRLVQSLDIQELIENTKMQAAIDKEPVDVDALEAQIQEILARGVVDPGSGIPEPLTGQKPGPATEVFPQTSEYTTPAESGSTAQPSGTPVSGPPPSSGGSGGSIPPVSSFGGFGGGFGGSGGGQAGGTGGTGGSGGPGGIIPAMTSTTTGLLQLTVALTALTGASKVVTEGFSTIGRMMENPQDPQIALQAGGATTKAGTTGIAGLTGLIARGGNPSGALAGVVVGKAIGAVIVDPIVEAINVGMGAISSVAKESIASQTVQAKAEENVNLLIKRMEQAQTLDPITADFVEARSELANAILELKTAFIAAFGENISAVVDLLTNMIELLTKLVSVFSMSEVNGSVMMSNPITGGIYLLSKVVESLSDISSNTNETARNTTKNASNIVQSINDFFMGQLSPEESLQGSFGASNSTWAINQNMATI
jgi:hypothetical protein